MNGTKPWYSSTTLWGAIVTILAQALAAAGYTTDALNSDLAVALATVGGAIGAIVSARGRMRADKRIG